MKVWLYPGSFRVPVWSGSEPCACQFLLTLTTEQSVLLAVAPWLSQSLWVGSPYQSLPFHLLPRHSPLSSGRMKTVSSLLFPLQTLCAETHRHLYFSSGSRSRQKMPAKCSRLHTGSWSSHFALQKPELTFLKRVNTLGSSLASPSVWKGYSQGRLELS